MKEFKIEDSFNLDDISEAFVLEGTNKKVKRLQDEAKKVVRDKKVYRRFLRKQYRRVREIDELLGYYPKKDEQVRIITQKSFNAFSILLYILERGEKVEEIYLTTYSVDVNSIKGLEMLVKSGDVGKLTILVSESVNFRMPKRAVELQNLARNNKGITLIFAWNHTKIILAKTKDNYYVVEGSGNLTAGARIEQYLFENCKETYNFHKSWIDDINTNDYKRVEKIGGENGRKEN